MTKRPMRTLPLIGFTVLVASLAPSVSLPSESMAAPAAPPELAPDAPISDADKKAAIQALAQALRQRYVFPEIGARYASSLLSKLAAGGYRVTTTNAFAEAVAGDLQAVNKDKHLRVRFDPSFHPQADPDAEPTVEEKAAFRKMVSWQNFGIDKVERLPGNVGLLDLRGFIPVEMAGPSLSAAMNLVASTDALIIDLRQNGGGDPETVAFLCTYLFPDGKRVHVNDIYDRPKNETRQFWTEASVPGTRYVGKPVYVLTSARTFSGAEELSYDLQALKRATLVGETTGGGAHPGDAIALGAGLVAFIPSGRAINPITKTNWEHVGVKPDVAAPAAQALQVAHLAALHTILKGERDEARRKSLERAITMVQKGEAQAPVYARP